MIEIYKRIRTGQLKFEQRLTLMIIINSLPTLLIPYVHWNLVCTWQLLFA